MTYTNRPKIGLALGSGGSRGLSHIGVIKTLNKYKIPIDFIAGSSIGAAVAAFYAISENINDFEKILPKNNWMQALQLLTDPSFGGGLFAGHQVEKFLRAHLDKKDFSELLLPLSVVTTDLDTGETFVINKGDVVKAIRASVSIPLLFKPVNLFGRTLIDGGASQPVPVETVREMGADLVIAVNLDAHYFTGVKFKNTGYVSLGTQTFNIMRYHLAQKDVRSADIVISPNLRNAELIGVENFVKPEQIIKEGERVAEEVMPKILKMLK